MKKKIFLCFLSIFLFAGCTPTKQIQLKKPATLLFFYVQNCSQCQAFKKDGIPLLQKTFGNQLTIHQYDLDEETTEPIYDKVYDSLKDFDEEFYGNGPLIVLDGYFALLGYRGGDEDYLIQDIEKATAGEKLGYELEGTRFTFK